jgi:hypothetical protein
MIALAKRFRILELPGAMLPNTEDMAGCLLINII